jgi:hypothetical protein
MIQMKRNTICIVGGGGVIFSLYGADNDTLLGARFFVKILIKHGKTAVAGL